MIKFEIIKKQYFEQKYAGIMTETGIKKSQTLIVDKNSKFN